MSTFGWLAFIVLPILGGVIAWAGDVIGYRLGKSRRSLFGLRPRTTARVIGFAVGVALPLVGVLVAVVGSSEARDALFHIKELRQQQVTLTQQNQDLEERQQRTLHQARVSEQRALALRADLFSTQRTLKGAQSQLAGASRELGRAQAEVRKASGNASRLQQIAVRLQAFIGGLQDRLKGLEARLGAKSKELDEKVALLTTKQAEVNARQAQVDTLSEQRDALRGVVKRLLTGPVELETGHELVRTIVNTGATVEDTEDRVLKVILAASAAAEGHGANPGPNGLAVQPVLPWPADTPAGAEVPAPADVVRGFVRDLQGPAPRAMVVGVRVASRMYRGQALPVLVELWALPYVRVFVENETIYAVEIDGSRSRGDIFAQLTNLLKILVRREAREKGLLADAKTGEYGEISPEQFVTALDQIAAHDGPVSVRVVAAADTYIADKLLIRIEVGKKGGAARGGNGSGD